MIKDTLIEGDFMNRECVEILKQFIKLYKNAKDKEAFITMWEETLSVPDDKPYTLEDAYNEAYGMALAQL
jgi:hypothetical protein